VRLALTARVGSDELQRGTLALGAELGHGSVRGVVEGGVSVPASRDPWIVSAPLRAGVAIGDAPTFIVDAVAIPFEISLGTGDRNVIAGAGVEVRGEHRLGSLDLVYEVGVDGFAKQVEYQWHGTPLYATPRVTAWSGLGVRWRAW
jgi:hypothetical protein